MRTTDIFENHDLIFDPGDPLNGSLYLCCSRNQTGPSSERLIETLRIAGIWSKSEPKLVPDEQRDSYKSQLEFIEAVSYVVGGKKFTIACFDHPKYPSDEERWGKWKTTFDRQYVRI
ncbi:MAG TPA: hypothetical protein DGR97_13930 [Gammaproteobacteria bacterium]|nr:hypothetical protein [Gammaproteobacteria bacterium]|tara:strand:+ start:336 stop:686 length:351 start_codon:yes stop_codon:yes gene_type:complete